MPIPAYRRTVLVAALLPSLALVAACGGGDGKPTGVKASGAVPAAALTRALLTSDDVPHVQVLPSGSKDQLLGSPQKPDHPECQAVADQWASRPAHPRQVYAGALVTDTADAGKDKGAKAITLEVVASYRKGEAEQVLDDLTASLRNCHGYKVTRGGVTTEFTVTAVPASGPPLGDQQVTYTIGDKSKGAAGVVLVTVVRTGDATAAYETVRADHRPATLRAAIALKQAEKLKKAAAEG